MNKHSLVAAKNSFIQNIARLPDGFGETLKTIASAAHPDPKRAAVMANNALLYFSNPLNEKVLRCAPNSILGAYLQLCVWGFDLNPASKNAYLIPRYNKNSGQTECNLQLGQYGYLTFARRDLGKNYAISTEVVMPNEKCVINVGTKQIDHTIDLNRNIYGAIRPIFFYGREFIDGQLATVQGLSLSDIQNLRYRGGKKDPSKDIWETDFCAMACTKLMGKIARRHFSHDYEGTYIARDGDEIEPTYAGYSDDESGEFTQYDDLTPPNVTNPVADFVARFEACKSHDEVKAVGKEARAMFGVLPPAVASAARTALANNPENVANA